MPLVELELLILSEHMSSSPALSGIHVTRSLVLCVCFVDRCLSFCAFSFGHCVVCSSSIDVSDYHFGIFKLFLQLFKALFHINLVLESNNFWEQVCSCTRSIRTLNQNITYSPVIHTTNDSSVTCIEHLQVFSKPTGVIVYHSFSITKGFHQWIHLQNSLFQCSVRSLKIKIKIKSSSLNSLFACLFDGV